MTTARVEILVEPFRENDPGPHVTAAVDALEAAGLTTDMGPFATTATGELDQVLGAVTALLRESFEAGADAIQVRVERTD
ncbi:thiamine-binding protein [Ilumatobacter nonamiensis]|uniref:thiamine-binding protein n=1 Tax=Ilumatobacter nonamiensis TaxID=467093 RepID=UPI00034BC6EE|nr:thiamine-binding protein [Ilumatobacter nonamiensis]